MPELLKNRYTKAYIAKLAKEINSHANNFSKDDFLKSVLNKDWEHKELKARMSHISDNIYQYLNQDYKKTVSILCKIAPEFDGFEGMFAPHLIQTYGLDHWDLSIKALAQITPHASAEFAVREFIKKDKKNMMQQMLVWSKHPNEHHRRLASEGCRPRLPWACALPEFRNNPRDILPILEQLKSDQSLYVRKSVANNINDISKDNPEIALDLIRLWHSDFTGENNEFTDWILKHGARTLLKSGNKTALHLFKLHKPRHVYINDFICDKQVSIGKDLAFSFTLNSKTSSLGKLRIEYRIGYRKASGNLRYKIFKVSEKEYSSIKQQFKSNQSFKQMTTRMHYPGHHTLAIIVNGENLIETSFTVKNKAPKKALAPYY